MRVFIRYKFDSIEGKDGERSFQTVCLNKQKDKYTIKNRWTLRVKSLCIKNISNLKNSAKQISFRLVSFYEKEKGRTLRC